MARICTKPFVLNLPDGNKKSFVVGEQVDDALASHWYVEAHTEELAEQAKPKAKAKTKEQEAPKEPEAPQQPEQQP